MTRAVSGKPRGKPRGKPFKKGVSPNPGGRPKGIVSHRKIDMDARLLARDHSIEAVRGLVEMMRGVVRMKTIDKEGKPVETDVIVPPTARITAMVAILDRGYGRPPQALEIFGGDVKPEEREGSALEALESKLAELGRRERDKEGPVILN